MSANEIELTFIRCPSCKSLMPSSAVKCGMCGFELDSGNDKNVGASSPENRKTRLRQRTGSGSVDDLIDQSEESESSVDSEENASRKEQQTVESPRPRFAPVDESRPGRTGTALYVRPKTNEDEFDSSFLEDEVEALEELESDNSTSPVSFRQPKIEEEFSKLSEEEDRKSFRPAPSRERNDDRRGSVSSVTPRTESPQLISDDEGSDYESSDDEISNETDESDDQPKKKRRRRKKKRRILDDSLSSEDKSSFLSEKHESRDVNKDIEGSHAPVRSRPLENLRPGSSDVESLGRKLDRKPEEERKHQVLHQGGYSSEPTHTPPLPKIEPKERSSFSAHVGERKMSQSNGEAVLIGWFVNYSTNRSGVPFEIRLGKQFIGRQELRGDDLIIQDSAVSTPHCLLQVDDARTVLLQDLMSENGTFVKKRGESEYHQLESSIKLEHGDRVKLGSYELIVCLVP